MTLKVIFLQWPVSLHIRYFVMWHQTHTRLLKTHSSSINLCPRCCVFAGSQTAPTLSSPRAASQVSAHCLLPAPRGATAALPRAPWTSTTWGTWTTIWWWGRELTLHLSLYLCGQCLLFSFEKLHLISVFCWVFSSSVSDIFFVSTHTHTHTPLRSHFVLLCPFTFSLQCWGDSLLCSFPLLCSLFPLSTSLLSGL